MGALLLWQRIAASAAPAGKFKELDILKARRCTKFVGRGAPGSFTEHFRSAAGDLANCSQYSAADTVMVSVNGRRDGRLSPVDSVSGHLRGVYARELWLAAHAGASVVADTLQARTNGYNVGEEELAVALAGELGYREHGDSGVWRRQPPSPTALAPSSSDGQVSRRPVAVVGGGSAGACDVAAALAGEGSPVHVLWDHAPDWVDAESAAAAGPPQLKGPITANAAATNAAAHFTVGALPAYVWRLAACPRWAGSATASHLTEYSSAQKAVWWIFLLRG
jgi:hypothetical protein